MIAGTRTVTGTARPATVTIRGEVAECLTNRLVVKHSDGRATVVDPEHPDVTVEYAEPERQWTDGDVLEFYPYPMDRGVVWVRVAGEWRRPAVPHGAPITDEQAERTIVASERGAIVRYQAGE